MALLQLPLDILDHMVQSTMPEGFESWLLTCKMLHQVGHRFLTEYNTLTRTRKHVDIADEGSAVKNIAEIFLRVLEDPVIAPYVEEARLWTGRGYGGAHSEMLHNDKLDQLWEHNAQRWESTLST